jgi:acetyl-CoA acyltransferase
MQKAVIVAAARTAVGKAPNGTMKHTRPEEMGAAVITELLKRAPNLDPAKIDDVMVGCTFPESEQGLNLGRVLVAKAGLPDEVPGMTINRFCSSGLQSIATACERIICGMADVIIAGGVESMSLIPMGGYGLNPDPGIIQSTPWAYEAMGQTAENVARKFNITREEQDVFALESHKRACRAIADGRFKEQIVPLTITRQHSATNRNGYELINEVFDTDEGPRQDANLKTLTKLKPAFRLGGSVTAGNSSQMSDGAAMVLCMSMKSAENLGLKPMLAYRSYAVAGVDPRIMGVGPIAAIPKALQLAGLSLEEVDLVELNEAFASQAVYCMRELGLSPKITNVNGGAIALGHPLGCTGAKLTTQIAYELAARKKRYGLVSMCIGFGMGAAGIFENLL